MSARKITRTLFVMAICLFAMVDASHAEDVCPAVKDRELEKDAIITRLQSAGSDLRAREIMNELWLIWADAPDEKAQAMLDAGMSSRSSYDYEGAIKNFDALIDYCPAYAEGWNQRAFIHFLSGNYGAAVTDLEKALEINPKHIAAMSGLALSLVNLGRIKAGHGVLREALKLNPWLSERYLLPQPSGEKI